MKLITGILCACVFFYQTCAALPKAYVFTFDESSRVQPISEPAVISPTTARLLFAKRLGLSQFHDLDRADENTIKLINRFGGSHEQIFIDEHESIPDVKVLVFVENVERLEDVLDADSANPAFVIDHPPSPLHNLQLALDLLNQDYYWRSKNQRPCHVEFPKSNKKGFRGGINTEADARGLNECRSQTGLFDLWENGDPVEIIESTSKSGWIPGSTYIIHISMLEGLSKKDGESFGRVLQSVKQLLRSMQLPRISGTVVLLPPNSSSSGNSKHDSTSPYGTSTNPPSIQRRGHILEEPLTNHAIQPLSSTTTNNKNSSTQTPKTNTIPKTGVLPLCQPSQEKCISATNNCSSHGTPYRKPADPSANSAKECWTCRCESTLRTDKDGNVIQTTPWGGPACQKKDVSVPFFLLAGLTVALIATVSWGVGLLYGIGQEDLPSVIGAGVTGPRAQK